MPTTANFSWTTPVDGGSPGVWGGILNAAFDAADANLKTVKDTADAAMPKAGGEFTGNVDLKTGTMLVSALGSVSGAVTLNLNNADYFTMIKGDVTTFTFSNWPTSGKTEFFILEVDHNADLSGLVFPGAVKWDNNTAPDINVAGFQIFLFWSNDAGTTVFGKEIYENTTL